MYPRIFLVSLIVVLQCFATTAISVSENSNESGITLQTTFEERRNFCLKHDSIYNEGLNKCIRLFEGNTYFVMNLPCDEWDPTIFQCGLGNMSCMSASCKCVNDDLVPTGDKLYCVEGKNWNQTCDSNQNPCKISLSCDSTKKVCTCPYLGIWNPIDSICYSDSYCRASFYRESYYEVTSGTCKCNLLSDQCAAYILSIQNSTEEFCPVRSTYKWAWNPHLVQNVESCVCDKGYISDQRREICLIERKYGESCNMETKESICNPNLFQICINGTCACEPGSVFDRTTKSCKSRAGGVGCSLSCTPYSRCTGRGRRGEYTCQCSPDYEESNEGRCVGGYQSKCAWNTDCHDGLVCADGFCECERMNDQFYDEESDACKGYIGSTCRSQVVGSNSISDCPRTAVCDTNNSVCSCDVSYNKVARNGKKCYEAFQYNASCEAHQCDFSIGLACIDSKCSCFDPSFKFHNHTVGCLAPVGSRCGVQKVRGTVVVNDNEFEFYRVKCEPHLECTGMKGMGLFCQARKKKIGVWNGRGLCRGFCNGSLL